MKAPSGSKGIEICGPSSTPGERNMHPHMSPTSIDGFVKGPDTLPATPPSAGAAVRDSVLGVPGQYKGTGN